MDLNTNSDYDLKEFHLGMGSRKFQFVADAVGLPIDQVNFIFGQLFAILFAFFFRVFLHPGNASAASRHWTALSAGLCISYFCFGKQMLLAIVLVVLCYCLLHLLPETIFHHATLWASITFLSLVHLQKQFYEEDLSAADITGPLMIIVQKATSLAYSLNDGLFKDSSKLTNLQKKFLVRSKPAALEYFSYLLCFHSILAGPFFMFTDYQDFIEGTHSIRYKAIKKRDSTTIKQEILNNNRASGNLNIQTGFSNKNNEDQEMCPEKLYTISIHEEPNPTEAALVKFVSAFVCAMMVVFVLPKFPIRHLSEPSFLSSSLFYKLTYIAITTTMARQIYYTAWYLAETVCISSGFGFTGYDENGKSKWDIVSNVDFIGVEFGTSLKITLESWNTGTMKWLRFLVYERAPTQKTVLTYLVSSIWHGFYPGYYLTFLGGAFFTIISRTVRRSIRPRVMKFGTGIKRLYDFTTFLATRLCLSYITFPFVLLRFWPSIYAYSSLKCYLHILGLLAMVVLPQALPPIKESKQDPLVDTSRNDRVSNSSLTSLLNEKAAAVGIVNSKEETRQPTSKKSV